MAFKRDKYRQFFRAFCRREASPAIPPLHTIQAAQVPLPSVGSASTFALDAKGVPSHFAFVRVFRYRQQTEPLHQSKESQAAVLLCIPSSC